jgi:hypothetical protein
MPEEFVVGTGAVCGGPVREGLLVSTSAWYGGGVRAEILV